MGYKIFVSYKYSDSDVRKIDRISKTTVRDYVDILQNKISSSDNLNKGEKDNESLSQFKDETIRTKLKDKIYDSSITAILLSKNMKDQSQVEGNQWIPWEVSYSLRNKTREGKTSKTNAMLAIVLPDVNSQYKYFLEEHYCPQCETTLHRTNTLFKVIKDNMFNQKNAIINKCDGNHEVFSGEYSYIKTVKWDDFISNINLYLDKVTNLREKIDEYDIKVNVE